MAFGGLLGIPSPGALEELRKAASAGPALTAPSSSGGTKAPKPGTARTTSGPSAEEVARRERAAAEARAIRAANNAARQSARTDIERLNAEITANLAKRTANLTSLEALKKLVGTGPGSHAAVRDNALATIDRALKDKLAQITATFETTRDDFFANLRDNEESEADSSFSNLANRAREKQDLVTQALSQGAGESDILRAQLQALRNWSANQGDINRAFFDTRSSINSGITDLNAATRTGRMNEELAANAARAERWDDYYEALGSTYTEMANIDQQNYLLNAENAAIERQKEVATGLLKWLDSGKNAADYKPPALKSTAASKPPKFTSQYAQKAAEAAGSVWKDPGLSAETQNWQGAALSTGGLNTAQLWNAPENTALTGSTRPRRPEGATLRRW